MRIALTTTELRPGGAEKCLVNLAVYLRRQGHEVRVWQILPPPPKEQSELVQHLEAEGIPWRSGNAVSIWHFLRILRWLRDEFRSFRPDVVQSFLFHANVACALATSKRTPAIRRSTRQSATVVETLVAMLGIPAYAQSCLCESQRCAAVHGAGADFVR